MKMLLYLSEAIIPLLLFYIIGTGLIKKQNVYEDFLSGAKTGIMTAAKLMPTLIGLMVAVGVLRASGFLDFLSELLGNLLGSMGISTELVPIALIKMVSSSAATGLLLDLYKQYGTDSFLGLAASIMLSCTETIFYTMSVYFMAAKVSKTRYTLAGAIFSTVVGIVTSIFMAGLMI